MLELFKNTVAYKIILGDKSRGELSHAYAICHEDQETTKTFIKILSKILLCDDETFCNECRACRLIEKGTHSDVTFYPKTENGKILSGDIDELIAQTYVKPIESEKRVFALTNTSSMNGAAQNKLLKTLEEPPKNVFIILGVENENALLPTVKSRVKKLEIPPFSESELLNGLKNLCPDQERLERAISFADGKASKVIEYFNEEEDIEDGILIEKINQMIQEFDKEEEQINEEEEFNETPEEEEEELNESPKEDEDEEEIQNNDE